MKGKCSVEGCEEPHSCRGYCKAHHRRWYRHGDPLAPDASHSVKPLLPMLDEIRHALDYNQTTGRFTWLVDTAFGNHYVKRAGTEAGNVDQLGYRIISINGVRYKAHRLAWLLSFGTEPPAQLDHKNRRKDDNRLDNLRAATPSQNSANRKRAAHNRSGVTGVSWIANRSQWSAYLTAKGKRINLGWFASYEEAVAARMKAASRLFDRFSPHIVTPAQEAA